MPQPERVLFVFGNQRNTPLAGGRRNIGLSRLTSTHQHAVKAQTLSFYRRVGALT